ncbi:MAG: HAD-IB family hydrolase [Candidatus Paceibacterota bacterium]|jgi:HAD superfamily hydrolase (TIGR01490 family)
MKKQTPVKNKKRKVAVFDIDGTIFRSSLLIEIVEALIDGGCFKPSVREKYIHQHERWLDRKGDYDSYIMAMVRVFEKNIVGVHKSEFDAIAKIVIKRQHDRLYIFTSNLIKEFKAKGYFLLAISQSPKAILGGFCKKLGFDKVYGRLYEVGTDGKFTGRIIDEPVIAVKSNILKRAVERRNLTLKGSVGVGDTEGDISVLEMVENPICFNPNAKLYKHAKKKKWEIVVERKDVIYEL